MSTHEKYLVNMSIMVALHFAKFQKRDGSIPDYLLHKFVERDAGFSMDDLRFIRDSVQTEMRGEILKIED